MADRSVGTIWSEETETGIVLHMCVGTGAALTGLVIGGPLGAVVGGAAGAVVGSVAQANMRANGTFQAPSARPVITERTCVEDAAGNQTCHEATR